MVSRAKRNSPDLRGESRNFGWRGRFDLENSESITATLFAAPPVFSKSHYLQHLFSKFHSLSLNDYVSLVKQHVQLSLASANPPPPPPPPSFPDPPLDLHTKFYSLVTGPVQ